MCVMTSGMAHISGGMMAAYIRVGGADAKSLLTAVIMTAPGTLLMAKMLVPETGTPLTAGRVEMPATEKEANILGAIARGTVDGLHLALNVGAMLITFLALLALLNAMMGWTHIHIAWFPSSLQQVLGWVFAPVAWLIGIPWRDAGTIGNLLGTRMVLNEFVAFAQLGTVKGSLDPRTFTIATFALCGFANFSSIGIQIGGIGALAPNQRGELARLGLRAMLAGTMANLMSASIAGIILWGS
jgi:CNT family concentrative nucleoside transporter